MLAKRIKHGDTIGFVCPCHIASAEKYNQNIRGIESLGFKVKVGKNIYKDTYGYLASELERSNDFNDMVYDDEVKMIFFGGGEGGNELLPYLDFDSIKSNPKIICGFSDGTTILNAIHSKTGLITYYGQGPGMFNNLSYYDYKQFSANFLEGTKGTMSKNSDWKSTYDGKCEGKLVGGYLRNFAMMLGNDYFKYDIDEKYILFLEDYEQFSSVAKVSSFISHIEQHKFINNVSGLIFGHYSTKEFPELLSRLNRFGKKHNIPVIYTDDFGHGDNHAILPIGVRANMDANNCSLKFI